MEQLDTKIVMVMIHIHQRDKMIRILSKIKNKFFPKKLPSFVKISKNAYVNPYSQIGCEMEVGEWTTISAPIIVKGGKKITIGKTY